MSLSLLTPNPLSPSGYNYSFIYATSSWQSCAIPPQSTRFNLVPYPTSENYQNSSSFSIKSSMYNSVETITEDEDGFGGVEFDFFINAGSVQDDCFILECTIFAGPGAMNQSMFGDYYPVGKIYGTVNEVQLTASVTVYSEAISSACTGYVGGNMIPISTNTNEIVIGDVVTCTINTNDFTALSIALTYMLTSYSIMRMVEYVVKSLNGF